jgi:hypothetical protein
MDPIIAAGDDGEILDESEDERTTLDEFGIVR